MFVRLVYMKQSVWLAVASWWWGGGISKLSFWQRQLMQAAFIIPFFSKQLLATACLEVPGIEPATKFPEWKRQESYPLHHDLLPGAGSLCQRGLGRMQGQLCLLLPYQELDHTRILHMPYRLLLCSWQATPKKDRVLIAESLILTACHWKNGIQRILEMRKMRIPVFCNLYSFCWLSGPDL